MKEKSLEPKERFFAALAEELNGDFSEDHFRKLGLETDVHFVLYAEGISPVVRFGLSDGKKFSALLDRIEAKAEIGVERSQPGGVELRRYTIEEMSVLVAISPREGAIAVGPSSSTGWLTKKLIEVDPSLKSLEAAGDVTALAQGVKGTGVMVGAFDVVGLVSALSGDGSADVRETLTAWEVDTPVIEDGACKKEFMAMAMNMPKATFRSSILNSTMRYQVSLKVKNTALMESLTGLQTRVPGLGMVPAPDDLVVLGLGFDLKAGIAWLREYAGAVKKSPFVCKDFQGFNEGAENILAETDSKMLPPFVFSLKGVYAVLRDFDVAKGLQSAEGMLLVHTSDPAGLWGQLIPLVPSLGGITLSNAPTLLPAIPNLPVGDLFALQGSDVLALGVGEATKKSLKAFAHAKAPTSPPLFVVGYNMGGVMKKISKEIPEESVQMMETVIKMYDQFEMVIVSVYITPTAIHAEYVVNLKAP